MINFNEYSTGIVAIATVVLAIITTLYLLETKKTRSILEDSLTFERNKFKIENQPILYVKEIHTFYDFSKGTNSEFEIKPNAKIVNKERTPADNLRIQHRIYEQGSIKPNFIHLDKYVKIYPEQNIFMFNEILSEIGSKEVVRLQNEYKSTNKFSSSPQIPNPIYWEILIEFIDIYEQEHIEKFRYKYNYPQWELDKWVEW